MIAQQLENDLERSPKLKVSSQNYPLEFPDAEANKVIAWNPAGNALINTTVGDVTAADIVGGSANSVQYNSGSAFEGDNNFTTNGSGTVTVTGQLTVDNIRLDGNTISSTNTNGDINIDLS